MELILYEDQTGQSLSPDTKDKNGRITTFFNKNVDLYVEKKGDNIEIFCHILATKGSERKQGYYIRYKGSYDKNYFASFKRRAQEALIGSKFQIVNGDIVNTIFENIEKFDNDRICKDIDVIIKASKEDDLVYKDGNINEISRFCSDILDEIKNTKMSISSEDNKLGNINILRNRYEGHLNPTESTRQILEKCEKIIEQERRDNTEKVLSEKIKEEIDTLKNNGTSEDDIKRILFPNSEKTQVTHGKEKEGKSLILIPVCVVLVSLCALLIYSLYSDSTCDPNNIVQKIIIPKLCKQSEGNQTSNTTGIQTSNTTGIQTSNTTGTYNEK